MKHKAIYVFVAVLMAFSLLLSACGGGGGQASNFPDVKELKFDEPMVVSSDCGEGDYVKEIAALDEMTVQFTMCKPDPTFLAKAAFTPFAVQPREWIEQQGGETRQILELPIGTGPYMLDSWERGDSVNFAKFNDYWGEPAKNDKLVLRWATESVARLLELQSGTVQEITNLAADDFAVVEDDENLVLLPQANPNILYLAMTNTFEPWGDPDVRLAIAKGIDRQRIVDNVFPTGSVVASHFTPCEIPNGCDGDAWYDFDVAAAKQHLADAGYPDGFETKIFYRDVFRVYLPEPGAVAVEIQTQLKDNLNIDAEVVVMESGEFIDESTNGRLDGMYMLGWGADYMHIINFLDFHFTRANPQFGDPFPEIYETLETAASLVDPGDLYVEANNAVRDLVPMVPIVHGSAAYAALKTLDNAHAAPLGPPLYFTMTPAEGTTLVAMQNAEPISLYCADETDGESLSACRMVTEGLYVYNQEGAATPALATGFEANDDATVWTFTLRDGVVFHNGSKLDANDVVASYAAALDATSPYHLGNTGSFEYPAYLFGLMND